jgi:coenzyme F420-reducing hydrogenase beta subunit
MYQNVSSVYEIRTIEEIEFACQKFHKNHSMSLVSVNFLEELNYEGCSKCKKKIGENGCFQCGSNVAKQTYQYLKVILEDGTGMLESAIFDGESQKAIKNLKPNDKIAFLIKSSAKRNLETNEPYTSHVITGVKESINSKQ